MSRIEDDIKELVFQLTGFKDDERSFEYSCTFMREALCEDTPISRSSLVKKLETYATKFDYLGFSRHSSHLLSAMKAVTDDVDEMEENMNWSFLDLILQLSDDVFNPEVLRSLDDKLTACRSITYPENIPQEIKIDWFKYLQEGSEKYRLPDSENEDSEDEYLHYSHEDKDETKEAAFNPAPIYNELFKDFTHPEFVVHDENTELKKTLKEAVDAKAWLMNSVQNSWWNGEESTVVKSLYPCANFGREWEIKQNETAFPDHGMSSHIRYHDEYKIIRELLLILIGYGQPVLSRIEALRTQTSVPSLIQETFAAVINNILNTADKYFFLTSFCNEVLGKYVLQISFTMKAFTFTLKDYCNAFRERIIELEKVVKKQDGIYTLLTLCNDLREDFQLINFLFDIHKECVVANWMEEASWICAIRILSVLLLKQQELSSMKLRKILLEIFLKTFKVHAEIIDGWFTEGKINDWKNEFFIQKSDDGNYVAFPYTAGKSRCEVFVSPLFHRLSVKLLNSCQSIDFLCKLNKMNEMKAEIIAEGRLIDQLLEHLLLKTPTTKLPLQEIREKDPVHPHEFIDSEFCYEFPSPISEVPFLMKAFADQLGLYDKTVIKTSLNQSFSIWEKRITYFNFAVAGPVLEQLLCDLIEKREAALIRLFRTVIVRDCRFLDHIRNLNRILLMDWNIFFDQFAVQLGKSTWIDHSTVRFKLYDCIESSQTLLFGDLFRFVIDDAENMGNFEMNVSRIIKAIDRVHLRYEVEWPLDMIFTHEIITNVYAPLLKLVLKIRFAFSTITRLSFKDIPQVKLYLQRFRKILVFRHWVILLLQKLHSYLLSTIFQELDSEVVERDLEIETFNSLLQSYISYLNKTKRNCLIENDFYEHFSRALNRIWLVCDDVVILWIKASRLQASDQDVSQSVELYLQCLWYLTKILQKFSKGVYCPLHDLWSDFNEMYESHKKNMPEDLSFKAGPV